MNKGTKACLSATAKDAGRRDLMEETSMRHPEACDYAVRDIPKLTVSKTVEGIAGETRPIEGVPVPLSRQAAQHPASRGEVLGWAVQWNALVYPP